MSGTMPYVQKPGEDRVAEKERSGQGINPVPFFTNKTTLPSGPALYFFAGHSRQITRVWDFFR
jgi:hypothetical protein